MFLLQCPKCSNRMKYQNADLSLIKKKKRCVYCGHSFSVNTHIVKKV
ncbi:MAG TPA: MJ0042-type zinc finger domain-containing protein [Candidatus Nanoarchaeia archaeon]|nr:MJ0042-type zinc finger domain-containing protein [Candidatus Nanoarchaeia archaeon]